MFKYCIIFSIGIFFCFFGCSSEQEAPISKEKMIQILTDIHLAESAAQSLPVKQKDTTMIKYYKQIMDIHEVSRADFDSTVVFWKKDPEGLAKIYEKVMEKIDTDKSERTK